MCGIFGWIKPRLNFTHNLDLDAITKKGMIQTMTRGKDATGFYCPTLGVVKSAVSADKFEVPSVKHDRFYIGHCRAASVGGAHLDVNAHPFQCEDFTMVHNGTCRNVKELKDYEYEGQTDSEIVLTYIHKYGVKEGIEKSGALGALVINDKASNKIYFWNNGDRELVVCRYRGLIFFASTKKIIRTSLGISKVLGLFDDANWYTVDDRELLCFDMYKSRNKFISLGITKEAKAEAKVFKYGSGTYTPYVPPSPPAAVNDIADNSWDSAYGVGGAWDEAQNVEPPAEPPKTKHNGKHGKHPRLINKNYDFTNNLPSIRKPLPKYSGSINPPSDDGFDNMKGTRFDDNFRI